MAERAPRPGRRGRAARRALLVGALTVGLVAGGGGAWAFWTALGTAAGPDALTSAALDLTVTGASGTLAGPGGTVQLPGLALTNAVPGSGDSEVFSVVNGGTAAFTPGVAATAQGALAPYLQTTVLYGGTDAGDSCTGGSTTAPQLAPGASVAVCVAVTVPAGTAASAQGASGTVSLALTAVQVPG